MAEFSHLTNFTGIGKSLVNKEVYALFTCDEWKMRDSFRFIGVVSSEEKLKEAVIKLIASGDVKYKGSSGVEEATTEELMKYSEYLHIEATTLDTLDFDI